MAKKKLTILIPCYNEEENVIPLAEAIRKVTDEKLPNYVTEILFIDNDSTDKTREKIRALCAKDEGVKAIFNAKMEITTSMGEDDWLIVNESGEYCHRDKVSGDYHLLMTGIFPDCDVRATNIREEKGGCAFTLVDGEDTYDVQLPVPGAHNALNATMALTAGKIMGIPVATGIEGLKELKLTGSRLKFEEFQGVTLIDDTYNANPDSMKSSIDVLMSREGTRKVAVLSDMRELGPVSEEMHRAVGEYAKEKGVDLLLGFGPETKYTTSAAGDIARWYGEEDLPALCEDLAASLKPGDVVLFKGSRGMRVERVLEDLRKRKLFG